MCDEHKDFTQTDMNCTRKPNENNRWREAKKKTETPKHETLENKIFFFFLRVLERSSTLRI